MVSALACAARGQLPTPQLKSVVPLGGQQGTSFELTIGGEDLDDVRELRFSEPGMTAEPKMHQPSAWDEPRPVGNQFIVHVAEDVPPGLVEVRAIGYFGVSNPRMFAVDTLRETAATSGNSLQEAAPLEVGAAVSAAAAAERVQYYKVHVPAGQKVLVECFAERLDSLLDATLVVFDQAGQEVARVRDTIGLDPVVLLTPLADQDYVVGVYDFTFRGGGEYFYRLAAHTRPRLVRAYPPVVQEGQEAPITLFGWNLPGGAPAAACAAFAHAPLEQVEVRPALAGDAVVPPATEQHAVFAAGIPYRLAGPHGLSNPVFIQTTSHPVVMEGGENNAPEQAEPMPVPGEFVGRIESTGDRDWIELAANRGDVLHLDVLADRIGAAADVVLAVHRLTIRDDGSTESTQLATVDDRPYGRDQQFDFSSTDPAQRIVVDEPSIYRIEVRDLYGNPTGDPRFVYRLSVRREAPDFRLAAFVEPPRGADNQPLPIGSLSLRRGSASAIVVCAHRLGGFDGPIDVTADGLPDGTTCRPATIAPGEARTTLVISAEEDAAEWSGPMTVHGRAEQGGDVLQHAAVGGTMTWPTAAPNVSSEARLCRGIELAVSAAPPSPSSLGVPEQVATTCVGGKLKIPVRLDRQKGFAADVSLTPVGLIEGMQFTAGPIAKDTHETEAELFVSKGDFQPGAYEFHVRSRVRANLPRNPEALAQQQNRKQRFDDLVSGKTSEVERLTAARDAIRATGETAASGLAAGEAELSAAREAANQAIAAQEEQGKRLAAAREGIATTATTAEAAPVLEKARVEAEAAIAAARAARAKLVELEAARASAQAAADVAATQLAIAERELQAATEVQAQLVQLRDEANRQLDEAQKAHGPRDYEFELISQPIRVVVEDAPIAVAVAAEPVVIAPSAAGSVTVEIERKFGFDGDVELKFLPPQGLAANAPPVRISKDAVSGALEVQCPPQAPLGRHACVMEASLQFNGVPITKHIPFEIVISATPE